MPELIMTRGLPASGKSTWAREHVLKSGAIRVNKDDLRIMLHGGKWSKANEKAVLVARNGIVRSALADGRDVIVDDTNFAPFHESDLRQIAAEFRATFRVQDFTDVHPIVCVQRDEARSPSVGRRVIWDMYFQYLVPTPPNRPDFEQVIVVDIDGTLAIRHGRSPFDWSRVGEDSVNQRVANLVALYDERDRPIVVVSGRDGSCREETEAWLKKKWIPYASLYMRAAGDNRPDWIVKREILHEQIYPNFDVSLVIDDRNQVVDMWRAEGLECWQVARGDF